MVKKYKVRDQFYVHFNNEKVGKPGEILDLEDEIAALHAHKIELVEEKPAKKAKAAKPDAGEETEDK